MEKAVFDGLEEECVKAETLREQACVENEPMCSIVCVKDKPSCRDEPLSSEDDAARGVSEVAAARLHADHDAKDELVIGTELAQPRRVPSAAQGQTQQTEPNGSKTYKCAQCNYTTHRNMDLSRHIRKHTMSTKSNSPLHDTMLTDKKPYKCNQCSYASARIDTLQVHKRKHTGERPYKCGQCSYACAHKSNLQAHKKTHNRTGEKPYKCDQCSFSSAHQSSLLHHRRTHSGKKTM